MTYVHNVDYTLVTKKKKIINIDITNTVNCYWHWKQYIFTEK